MIVGITGHRPQAIGGFNTPNPTYSHILALLRVLLIEIDPAQTITGMALGVDQWFAGLCIEFNIPFMAAVPFTGQETRWPKSSQDHYVHLIGKAKDVVVVGEGEYAAWKMQTRNQWIVDNSDMMIAVINSDIKSGGTYNCVEYAKKAGKSILYVHPDLGAIKGI